MTMTNTAYSLHSCPKPPPKCFENGERKGKEVGHTLHIFRIVKRDKTPGLELWTCEERELLFHTLR